MNRVCPCCGHQNWIRNGSYQSKNLGLVQRWRCKTCGLGRKEIQKQVSDPMLQALALIAMGLPLDQVERLIGMKSESIRNKLIAASRLPSRWNFILKSLSRYNYQEEIAYICDLVERASIVGSFSLKPRRPQQHASALKKRIESVIGTEALITRSRQGLRAFHRRKIEVWITRIQRLTRLRTRPVLDSNEKYVFTQIRNPSGILRILAALDAEEQQVVNWNVLPPTIRIEHFAKSMRMELGKFLSTLVSLARKLRL